MFGTIPWVCRILGIIGGMAYIGYINGYNQHMWGHDANIYGNEYIYICIHDADRLGIERTTNWMGRDLCMNL